MPPFLITQRGPEIGRRYDLVSPQFTIGRGTDNDLVLGDALVSRYHAVIRQENEGVVIIDLGSTNPVLVNDTPLEAGMPHRLQHRDIIVLGQNVFSFQNPPAAAPMPAWSPRPGEPATVIQGGTPAERGVPASEPAASQRAPRPLDPAGGRPETPPAPWQPGPQAAGPAWREEPPPASPSPHWDTPTYGGGLPDLGAGPGAAAQPHAELPAPDEAKTVISRLPGAGPSSPRDVEPRVPPPPLPRVRPADADDDAPTVHR
ncbi:MAG: FHA domain-containing protein [Chloroflexi bacterium]|nr:FHA domain-containing protein [Chloroflexota bacterium]